VELFESVFIPFRLLKAGTTVPYAGKTEIMIRRFPQDFINDNIIHLVEGHETVNKSLNKIKVPALPGTGEKIFYCDYNFKCFRYNPPPTQKIPLHFDRFLLSYLVTREQLISFEFKDPKIDSPLKIPSVPMYDFGPVNYTEWDEFVRNIDQYARTKFEDLDRFMETKILRRMKEIKGEIDTDVEDETLRQIAEKSILDDINPPDIEELKAQTLEMINEFKTWCLGQPKNYSSIITTMDRDFACSVTDTPENRIRMKNIQALIDVYKIKR
jgi:hypothetical protein